MASSTNSSAPRVARQNSSLFGAIKNIVAAPLTWLSGADQDGHNGKRRRLQADSEPDIDEESDQGTPHTKRIRVASPVRQAPSSSYLDPPSSAFQPFPKRRTPAPIARSSSASAYDLNPTRNFRSNVSRSTLSPIRLGRTMSVDPPLQLRRETSLHDVVMESAYGPVAREHSMPATPLASRPSFRMRSSLTPQPQREVSEPPPLTSLMSKPTFVRAPPMQHEAKPPVTTLGNLAETVRSNLSPVRQHSSLLFGTSAHHDSRERRSESVPVEKALHELDIYKTPLVPTRLRSANPSSSAAAIPDMFKSRRSSQLVLMHDDRRKVNGYHNSPQANETKPYAGEGGMKKLLARRKQEEDRNVGEVEESSKPVEQEATVVREDLRVNPSPAPPPSDWFSVASAGAAATSSGSSLRVGRSKTSRNHIARPSVLRSRLKFSAVFEEDGDDAMDGEEEARQRDRALLEEASKKMPAFEMPSGFSFAKPEAKPLQNDLTNAKEPPVSSLPFSFGKPAQLPEPSKPEPSTSHKENSEAEASKPSRTLAETAPLGVPSDSREARNGGREGAQSSAAPASSGVPNFFANSSLATKPLNLPATPPLSLSSTTTASSDGKSNIESAAPVNDKENLFWEGDTESRNAKSGPLFSHTPASSDLPPPATTSAAVPFSFEKPSSESQGPPASAPPLNGVFKTAPIVEGFSEPKVLFGAVNQTNEPAANGTPKPINIFGLSNTPKLEANGSTSQAATSTSAFSFGASSAAPMEQPKRLFGPAAAEGSKSLFGSAPPTEAPKPMFGSGSQFSLDTTEKPAPPKATAPTPFAFGATPSTPTHSNGASSFAFGASTPTAVPPPISFSFSGVGSNTTDVQSNAFSFGSTAPVNPTERPVTPPKNSDQEYKMEESPTREIQASGVRKPTLNFSFGNSTNPSALFGVPAQPPTLPAPASSSQFSFGAPASNLFPPSKTSEEAKPFSFGATSTSTATTPIIGGPFSFGPSTSSSSDAPRPTTGGGFSFGGAAAPTTAAAPFSFGNAAQPAPPSLFVTAPTASAPSSPSTFNQPSPFSFNAPLPANNSPFAFGSQPASPAGSNSGLPSTGFGAPSTGFGQAAPSSPFSSPAPLALSTSSGGTLFTIGAAPAQAPAGASGPRQIRKLPTRRTGVKR